MRGVAFGSPRWLRAAHFLRVLAESAGAGHCVSAPETQGTSMRAWAATAVAGGASLTTEAEVSA